MRNILKSIYVQKFIFIPIIDYSGTFRHFPKYGDRSGEIHFSLGLKKARLRKMEACPSID